MPPAAVAAGDYAGAGVSFAVCATVAEFTQVQFTISGSIGDCALELQLKTFDQTPTTGDPPGGCDSSTTSCYGYPAFKQIVVPTSTATDVVKPLADFSGWSAANARQVVGLQWQLTKAPASDPDAGTSCAVDIQHRQHQVPAVVRRHPVGWLPVPRAPNPAAGPRHVC